MDGPSQKDVIISIVGASAALAGLTLVFLGLVVNAYQSLGGDGVASAGLRLRASAWPIFAVLAIGAATIGLGTAWLALPAGTTTYRATLAFFAAELVGLVAVAVATIRRLLR